MTLKFFIRWTPKTSGSKKGRHGRVYQALKIANTYFNSLFCHAVSFIYHFGVTIIITVTYASVRLLADHRSSFMSTVGAFLGFMIAIIMSICLEFSVRNSLHFRTNSLEYINSYIRNDMKLSKLERLVLKSYYPLEVHVGNLFKFTSKSFCLHLFGDIIFQSVITLLLTFQ